MIHYDLQTDPKADAGLKAAADQAHGASDAALVYVRCARELAEDVEWAAGADERLGRSLVLVTATGGAPWLEDERFRDRHRVGVCSFSPEHGGRLLAGADLLIKGPNS